MCPISPQYVTRDLSCSSSCHSLEFLAAPWSRASWWVLVCLSVAGALGALYVHRDYTRQLEEGKSPPAHAFVLPVCFTLSSALLGGAQMIVQSKV